MAQKLNHVKNTGLDQAPHWEVDGKFKVVTTPLELFTNPFLGRRKDEALHMLVKFTEQRFALNSADSLSLATPEFYRKMKSWDGRVDNQEAPISLPSTCLDNFLLREGCWQFFLLPGPWTDQCAQKRPYLTN